MARLDVSATLEPEVLRELDRRSEEAGVSRSEIMNQLLTEAIRHRYRAQQEAEAVAQAGVGLVGLVLVLVLGATLLPLL